MTGCTPSLGDTISTHLGDLGVTKAVQTGAAMGLTAAEAVGLLSSRQ